MQAKPVYLTPEGKTKLEDELKHLRSVRRKEVAERIGVALEYSEAVGDPEYQEAKAELGFVEGRILTLESMLANAVIIEPRRQTEDQDVVRIGSVVVVRNEDDEEERYIIVGKAEASPANGKISNESPIGQALLDRRPGDEVEIEVPAGTRRLRVLSTT